MKRKIHPVPEPCMSRSEEFAWGIVILLLGVFSRIVFISLFPTKPVSDFSNLIDFAKVFGQSISAKGSWHWEVFNPGLSVALSVILKVFPYSPETVARWATAVTTGLIPLLPYAIWRGVVPFWVRVVAGILLALWPGQIFFSGVVSQDNWVLFPMVALAAFAVRSLIRQDKGHLIFSTVLFTLTVSIRQEMLVALLPMTAVAGGFASPQGRSWRNLLIFGFVLGLCMGGLAGYRYLGSGRFVLTTEHGGTSMLGAYVPGAHWNLWTDPKPYIASVDPSLLQDGKKLLKNAPRLAVEEAFRRPKFHFARIVYSMTKSFARLDSSNFWWSLLSPEVLSPIYRQRADHFVDRVSPLLTGVSGFIHAMFLAAFFIGLARRHWPILVLTSAVLLKILIHAVLVVQARYLVPVVAIELLVIALGAREALTLTPRWKPFVAILGGLVTVLFVGFAGLKAEAYVRNHDDHSQRTYRFTIYEPKGYGRLQCMIDQGRLTEINIQDASMMFLNEAPRLGEKARAVCQLTRSHKPGPRLSLQVIHPYYPGVLQGQMVERVVVNGKELFSCDLATKIETNRFEVALDSTGQETGTIVVEVEALRPDIGFTWGGAGRMTFGLIAEERK